MERVWLTGMSKVGCSHTLLDRMIKLTNVPEQRHVGRDKKRVTVTSRDAFLACLTLTKIILRLLT